MSPTAAEPATTAPVNNYDARDSRNCVYRGPLEALPTPTRMPTPEEGAAGMFSDGCVQFPDLFSAEEVRSLRDWMERSGGPDQQYEMKNWCFNKHIEADLIHDPHWLTLIDRAPVVEIVQRALGAGAACYGGSLWVTGQGREMGIHADDLLIELPGNLLLEAKARVPIQRASLHIYLDDQIAEIGPTLVIPGSHLAGRIPRNESTWNGITPKMVSVKAGGAVLFRHDLWHGAGMNSSKRRRYMIQVHYAKAWHHAPPASFTAPQLFDSALVAQMTERQRAILGERRPMPATT